MGRKLLLNIILLLTIFKVSGIAPPDTICSFESEKNLFRELPPIDEENIYFSNKVPYSHFKFVIITNRKISIDSVGKISYSSRRGNHLKYLVVNKLGNSWIINEKKDFLNSFNAINTNKPFLLYVHGFGRSFPGVIHDGAAFLTYYNLNLVIFDWPPRYTDLMVLPIRNVEKDNVVNTTPALITVLKEYQEYKKLYWNDDERNSTFLLHSLGNKILEGAVKDSLIASLEGNLFSNIILNAPAVDFKAHDKWVQSLDIQENIYITSNHKDFSFFGLFWLTMKKQLGGRRLPAKAQNATYVNFSIAGRTGHNTFLNPKLLTNNANVKLFYDSLFEGNIIETSNSCMFSRIKENYYIK